MPIRHEIAERLLQDNFGQTRHGVNKMNRFISNRWEEICGVTPQFEDTIASKPRSRLITMEARLGFRSRDSGIHGSLEFIARRPEGMLLLEIEERQVLEVTMRQDAVETRKTTDRDLLEHARDFMLNPKTYTRLLIGFAEEAQRQGVESQEVWEKRS